MTTTYQQRHSYQQRAVTLAEVVVVWRGKPAAHIPARSARSGLKIAHALMTVKDSTAKLSALEVRCQDELVAHYVSDHQQWRTVPVGP